MRLGRERFGLCLRQAGQRDFERDGQAEAAFRTRAYADRGGDRPLSGTFGPPCEATNFIAPMKQAA